MQRPESSHLRNILLENSRNNARSAMDSSNSQLRPKDAPDDESPISPLPHVNPSHAVQPISMQKILAKRNVVDGKFPKRGFFELYANRGSNLLYEDGKQAQSISVRRSSLVHNERQGQYHAQQIKDFEIGYK